MTPVDDRRNDREPPTADRLRADIDRGATGEKVDHPDPAAVPMGVDAEAGGHSPSPDERRLEALSRPHAPAPPPAAPRPDGPAVVPLILGVFALIAVVAVYVL
jgi:hypothetical protein